MDREKAVSYLRENIHRGFNHCSLFLCLPVPKLKKIAEEESIELPNNIVYVDFIPAISYLDSRTGERLKPKYFIIEYQHNGLEWCAEKMGVPVDEVMKIAESSGVGFNGIGKQDLDDFIVENYDTKPVWWIAEQAEVPKSRVYERSALMGFGKKGKRFKEYSKGKLSYITACTRIIRVILLRVSSGSEMKKDILSQIEKIEKFVLKESAENVDS